MKTKYFTTRPTMACHLLMCGYDGHMVKNPYNADRPAWEFKIVEGLMAEVRKYTEQQKRNDRGGNNG